MAAKTHSLRVSALWGGAGIKGGARGGGGRGSRELVSHGDAWTLEEGGGSLFWEAAEEGSFALKLKELQALRTGWQYS